MASCGTILLQLFYFHHGRPHEYTGPKSAGAITAWLRKNVVSPKPVRIRTAEDVTKLVANSGKSGEAMVGFFRYCVALLKCSLTPLKATSPT